MKKFISVCIIVGAIFMLALLANAQIKPETFTISPFVGGYTFDGDENLDTKPVFGLKLGYDFTSRLGLEGLFEYIPTKYSGGSRDGEDIDVFGYRVEGLYYFMPEKKLVPYIAVGVGGRSLDAFGDTLDRHNFVADYGVGVKYFMNDNFALRADIRHVILFNDNENNLEYTVGFTYYFGGKEPVRPRPAEVVIDSDNDGVPDNLDKCPGTPAGVAVDSDGCPIDSDKDGVPDYLDKCPSTPSGVVVDRNGCPIDSDKDGVPDYLDKCPGTPEGVKVDKDGCPLDSDKDGVADNLDKCPGTPAGVKVDKDGCPLDSDKDGVPDYLDKCPGTPAGVKVDKDGCPLDSDKDGVPDYLDKCPGTPAGVKVDKDGCPPPPPPPIIEKGRATINIEFDFNKAIVKPQYRDEIKRFADVMKSYPDLKLVIEGHTDNIGTETYNQKLSEKRATSVMNYMVKEFGIDASRLTAVGYGKSKPIDNNKTAEGRQKNRRVEAAVDYMIKK